MKNKRIFSFIIVFVLIIGNISVQNAMASNCSSIKNSSHQRNSEIKNEQSGNMSRLFSEAVWKKSLEDKNNYVTSLVMEGTVANIEYVISQEAEMIVAVYTEDEKEMLGSGKKIISPEETETQISLAIDNWPEFYMVKVFMLDPVTHKAIASPYTSHLNTEEMRTLLDSSIKDYEEEKVINFDTNEETNFAVYKSDVIVIKEEDTSCTVEINGDGQYIFSDATDDLKDLASGAIVSYEKKDGTIIVLEVQEINIDGNDVTIKEKADTELMDVFDYVKIESDEESTTVSIDESQLDEGIRYVDDNYYEPKDLTDSEEQVVSNQSRNLKKSTSYEKKYANHKTFEIDKTYGSSLGSVHVNGKLSIGISSKIKIYATLNYQEISISTDMVGSMSARFDGKGDIEIGLVDIIIYTNIPGLYLEFSPKVFISVSASANVMFTISSVAGVRCDNNNGLTNLSQKPTPKVESNIEGEISLGMSLKLSLNFIDEDFVSASVDPRIVVTANMKKHVDCDCICKFCMEGNINAVLSVDARVVLGVVIEKEWKKTFSKSLGTKSFYYSFDYKDWGWGSCPHTEKGTGSNLGIVGDSEYIFDDGVWKVTSSKITYDAETKMSSFFAYYTLLIDKSEFDYMIFDITLYDENRNKITDMGGIAGANNTRISSYITMDISNAKYYAFANPHYYKNVDANHSAEVSIKKFAKKTKQNEIITGLKQGEVYVIAIVKDPDVSDLFAPENLYYITQITADSTGEYKLECYFVSDVYNICVFGDRIATPTVTPSATPTVTPSATPTVTPSATPTVTPSATPTVTPSATPTVTPSATPTVTPSTTPIVTPTAAPSLVPADGSSAKPSNPGGNIVVIPVPSMSPNTVPEVVESESPEITKEPTFVPEETPATTPNPSNAPSISPIAEEVVNTNSNEESEIESPTSSRRLVDPKTRNIYEITKKDKTVSFVKEVDKDIKVLKIPSTIQFNGITYQVTSIGKKAFMNCKKLERIIIGNRVISIGDSAFMNCKNLKKIIIGNKVVSIGVSAFMNCKKIKQITIPKRVSKIGRKAFYGCNNLKKVIIKSTSLSKRTFGKKVFEKINKKAYFRFPKKREVLYQKLIKS